MLRTEDLPKPETDSAYVDNHGRIWLWTPDPPSANGKWRIPSGVVTKAGNPVMALALKHYEVKTLTRMAPVRRRKA